MPFLFQFAATVAQSGFVRTAQVTAVLVALASAAALLSTSSPLAAQTRPSKSPGRLVVVADASPDATANAKLRARVYESARGRGLVPDPSADVTSAATESGAFEAGSVSTDEGSLHGLRKALGAAVLIRVAPEAQGKARVVVVSETASKSAVVDLSDAGVTAAVASLLDELGVTAADASSAREPDAAPPGGVLTAASPGRRGAQTLEEEPIGPEAIRQRWEARGGLRASWEVRAMATALMHPDVAFSDRNPVSGAGESGDATTYGIGGGVGVRVSMIYLPLSQPHKGSSTWGAFRLGGGADGNVLYQRPPIGYTYRVSSGAVTGRDTQYDDKAFFYGILPIQLGFLVGFGSYRLDSIWRGTAIGLAYSPAVVYALEIGKTVGDFEFNYGGIEANLDIVSIEAGPDASADAQIRLSVLLLPRVRDELPWLLSTALGVAWY